MDRWVVTESLIFWMVAACALACMAAVFRAPKMVHASLQPSVSAVKMAVTVAMTWGGVGRLRGSAGRR